MGPWKDKNIQYPSWQGHEGPVQDPQKKTQKMQSKGTQKRKNK